MLRLPRGPVEGATAVLVLLLAPIGLVRLVLPDQPPPPDLGRPVREFSDAIWHLFELPPLTYARYAGIEAGPDDLAILYFEVRSYPYLTADAEVYLVSRCTPIAALSPAGMGGGTVVGSRATDPELEHLRSDAQPDCWRSDPNSALTLGRRLGPDGPHDPRRRRRADAPRDAGRCARVGRLPGRHGR